MAMKAFSSLSSENRISRPRSSEASSWSIGRTTSRIVNSCSCVSSRWVAPGLPETKTGVPSTGLSAFHLKWVGVAAGVPFSYSRMKAASMAKRGKLKLSRSPPNVAARSSGAKARRTSEYFL